jgi:hypothetical protein
MKRMKRLARGERAVSLSLEHAGITLYFSNAK